VTRVPAVAALLCVLGISARASAQQPPPAPVSAPAQGPAEQGPVAEPTKDLFDLLRQLRHKPEPPPPGPEEYKRRMVALAPVLTYGPTSGFGLGFAGNVAAYRGTPRTTSISSIVASVTVTTKEQVLVNAKINSSGMDNRWHFEGDNRLYWTSQKTYGLGAGTAEDAAVDQKYDYFRFYETYYRKVARHTYLGVGFLYSSHRDVRPADDEAGGAWPSSPHVAYSERYGFDPESQTSAGLSLNTLFDSRDGPINPSRGVYASLVYRTFFEGLLGGTSSWQQLSYDGRGYVRLSRDARHRLAFWLSGDFVVAGTAPYLDLPATGMDTYGRAGRGYPQGRFRGEKLVYAEAEYRWTATKSGLFGLVAFLNTQTFGSDEAGEDLFDAFATGAGVGFRLMLNKRSQTNLCLDIGRGKGGSHAVYFAVQEAF
jgi:outer membrane protein assembly factor BamA